MVAIPAFIFYSHLRTYARSLMHDMESAGIEILNTICDLRSQPSDIISIRPESEADRDGGETATQS
jgi:biopolymer transport protein ExbB